jgi:hypothetical protein
MLNIRPNFSRRTQVAANEQVLKAEVRRILGEDVKILGTWVVVFSPCPQ